MTLNTAEAAKFLGLSKRTMENLRVSGDGPVFVKIGRRVVYKKADLERFLEEKTVRSTSEKAKMIQ